MRRRIGASDVIGQVIGGGFGRITVRQKAGLDLEIGDILVIEEKDSGHNLIVSVFDLEYASQIDDKTHEMISGVSLEEDPVDAAFYEPDMVNYVIASIKPLVRVASGPDGAPDAATAMDVSIPKALPPFNSTLRPVSGGDLRFLERHRGGLFVGSIRSGSEVMEDVEIWMPIEDIFTHHVLIPATTGRGKSNLVKSMLWHVMDSRTMVGILVLDAHDEYYGRASGGLKDHPDAPDRLVYYTAERQALAGARTLAINLKAVEPRHFEGVVDFSDAQLGAVHRAYTDHGRNWIASLMGAGSGGGGGGGDDDDDDDDDGGSGSSSSSSNGSGSSSSSSNNSDDGSARGGGSRADRSASRATIAVIRRKLRMLLGLDVSPEGELYSRYGIFDAGTGGEATADDIVRHIESGRIVVLDTSQLASEAELVVGNIISTKLLERYKHYKTTGELSRKPVASIIIEEAPRVIGEDALSSKDDNIYATIAREGRKFRVGLVAVTQLSSVIPRTILANMTTKIILGNEMRQEREAIIASAHQDLSNDDKNIASLDKGEAIITSIFVPFAIPVKIPNFEDLVKGARQRRNPPSPGKIKVFG